MSRSGAAYSAPNTPPRFKPGDRVMVAGERAWFDGGPDVAGVILDPPDGWRDPSRYLVRLDYGYAAPYDTMTLHVDSLRPAERIS